MEYRTRHLEAIRPTPYNGEVHAPGDRFYVASDPDVAYLTRVHRRHGAYAKEVTQDATGKPAGQQPVVAQSGSTTAPAAAQQAAAPAPATAAPAAAAPAPQRADAVMTTDTARALVADKPADAAAAAPAAAPAAAAAPAKADSATATAAASAAAPAPGAPKRRTPAAKTAASGGSEG